MKFQLYFKLLWISGQDFSGGCGRVRKKLSGPCF